MLTSEKLHLCQNKIKVSARESHSSVFVIMIATDRLRIFMRIHIFVEINKKKIEFK